MELLYISMIPAEVGKLDHEIFYKEKKKMEKI